MLGHQPREIRVRIDSGSWPGPVPPAFTRLSGTQIVDLEEALIYTAVVTRPPAITGFHLSDFWAVLRYGPAFMPGEDLRLRPEWEELDPHQKTLLSDEMGVGMTCLLLVKALDLAEIVDTRYFLNALAGDRFGLGGENQIGSRKIPDYVAWRDPGSQVTVIECKGTQTPRHVARALAVGREQKANFEARRGGRIEHSVVAGLFIPRFPHRGTAEVRIMDPTPDSKALVDLIDKQEASMLRGAVRQIWLAKMFALLGFGSLGEVQEAFRDSLQSRLRGSGIKGGLVRELESHVELEDLGKAAFVPRRFTISVQKGAISSLLGGEDLLDWFARRPDPVEANWAVRRIENETILRLPMGFEAKLETEALRREPRPH